MSDPYNEGYQAFNNSKDIFMNPYADGLRAWKQWRQGWLAAARKAEL